MNKDQLNDIVIKALNQIDEDLILRHGIKLEDTQYEQLFDMVEVYLDEFCGYPEYNNQN